MGRVGSRIGAYPGTFDPPTVAHLAVAEAAWHQAGLAGVELVVSSRPLGKAPSVPSLTDRIKVLGDIAAARPWLSVRVTDRQLIAEVCEGYGAAIMGLDKWHQVMDPAWYGGSPAARDAAVASLPPLLLALRAGSPPPSGLPAGARMLEVHADHLPVSSSLARAGRAEWMTPEAARFDAQTGAWSDPERYARANPGTPPGAGTVGADPASLSPVPGQTIPSQE